MIGEILGIVIALCVFGLFIYRYVQLKKNGWSIKDMWNFKKHPIKKDVKSGGGGSSKQLEQQK